MGLIKPVIMAFCMFSRIPMPRIDWDDKSMRYMMCGFPLIGVVIGLVIAAWLALCDALSWNVFLRCVGITLIPLAITGGIHLDGFADVVDALSSCAEPERKREILKDPHIGAFAAMGVSAFLIAYLAFASQLSENLSQAAAFATGTVLEIPMSWGIVILIGSIHVQSRLASSFCTLCLKGSSDKGMLASFRKAGSGDRLALGIIIFEEIACIAVMAFVSPFACLALLLVCLAVSALVVAMGRRQFGGMSGDIAGFLLQVCEFAMLICLVVLSGVMML